MEDLFDSIGEPSQPQRNPIQKRRRSATIRQISTRSTRRMNLTSEMSIPQDEFTGDRDDDTSSILLENYNIASGSEGQTKATFVETCSINSISPSYLSLVEPKKMWKRNRHSRSRRYTQKSSFLTLIVPLLIFLLATIQPTTASQGDRSPEYLKCVDSCNRDSCLVSKDWDDGVAKATILPVILRLTFWSCLDDCRYHCTHRVTNEAHERVAHIRQEALKAIESNAVTYGWSRAEQRQKVEEYFQNKMAALLPVQKEMVQYHGKWVFVRLFGAQEPLSVLFSLANFYVHLSALDRLRKQVPDAFPLKLIYILHALVSCFAWLWSAIFHTRDKPFTEKMDYFSAGAVVLGGLFYAVCRLWRIAPASIAFKVLSRTFGVALALHILYLSFGRFDYSYNMKANILVGVTNSLLWLIYSFRPELFSQSRTGGGGRFERLRSSPLISSGSGGHHHNGGSPPVPVSTPISAPPSSSRRGRRRLQLILALLWLATLLEVLDFPPIGRALDAHALWHAATIPIARMWYSWLIEDARECTSTGFWVGDVDARTAAYLELPHKTEAAVENVTRAVGPPVMRAVERAREWVETAAVKTADTIGTGIGGGRDSLGASSGIEFKALTSKLNEFARGTLGNNGTDNSVLATSIPIEPISSSTTTTTTSNAAGKPHGRSGSAHARTSSINIGSRSAAV